MSEKMIRWGILGAAEIARKNWKAIWNSGNGVVTAVASRDLERSRRFVADCQREAPFPSAPRALGSYEEALAAKDVDAVYIPLPTGVRKPWVIRAAEAGKHVVCEKPCAPTVADLQEMLDTCARHGVQFMDGVMFMHSDRLAAMGRALHGEKSISPIKRIATAFSFKGPDTFFSENIRAQSALEPLGCLGDLGWYCIRFALWAMRWEMPTHVTGRFLASAPPAGAGRPVPIEFSGELIFGDRASAGFYCSFTTALQQWAHVSGANGCLTLPDFVLPFFGSELEFETHQAEFQVKGCEFNMAPRIRAQAISEYSNGHPEAQETKLFRNFAAQIQSGRLNQEWPALALRTQQVVEACLQSALSNSTLVLLGD